MNPVRQCLQTKPTLTKHFTFLVEWIQPVCLPERDLDVDAALGGRRAIVAGWGRTEHGDVGDVLLEVSLPHVGLAACNETYSGKLNSGQVG